MFGSNKYKAKLALLEAELNEKEAIIQSLVQENEILTKKLALMKKSVEIVARAKAAAK